MLYVLVAVDAEGSFLSFFLLSSRCVPLVLSYKLLTVT